MAETVEIVTSMWSQPETTYEGRYYQLDRAQCDPKPVQCRGRRSGSAAAASS